MPVVNGKHYPYTQAGYRAAKKAKRKISKRSYSRDEMAMAKKMLS